MTFAQTATSARRRPYHYSLFLSAIALLSSSLALASEDDGFSNCLRNLRPAAVSKGISAASYLQYTAALAADMSVLPLLDAQPEFKTPIWDYLTSLVDAERIADGKAGMQQWAEVLKKVANQYGVDPAVVVAVWGVESNFGKNKGSRPLLTSLATLSCYGRRQDYFRSEFYSTLKILQAGDVAQDRLTGSWAGAFGQTQFMPSTFARLAVDFDGDGRRDIVDSVPDALGSTANFLAKGGWISGEPWGFEVILPKGFDTSDSGRKNKRPIANWAAKGLLRADGKPLNSGVEGKSAGLLLPAGVNGPAFLVLRNFDVIFGYNAAESYALAIAHLSDRIKDSPAFTTPWPTDDLGLDRGQRRELQTLLVARGYDIGVVDGILGEKSRNAIKLEQEKLGQTVSGRAGMKLLNALRATNPTSTPAPMVSSATM